jgi:hypothetical protein
MKNANKIIIILICAIFVYMSYIGVILAFNVYHLKVCHGEDCVQCAMIHLAQKFIRILEIIVTVKFMISVICKIIKKIENKYFIVKTLINAKVQFNE